MHKLNYFRNLKDTVLIFLRSNIFCKFTSLGCSYPFIGKNKRNLYCKSKDLAWEEIRAVQCFSILTTVNIVIKNMIFCKLTTKVLTIKCNTHIIGILSFLERRYLLKCIF